MERGGGGRLRAPGLLAPIVRKVLDRGLAGDVARLRVLVEAEAMAEPMPMPMP